MEAWASVDATSQNSGHGCRRFNQVVPQSLRKAGIEDLALLLAVLRERRCRETLDHTPGGCQPSPLVTDTLASPAHVFHTPAASGSAKPSTSPFLFSGGTVRSGPAPTLGEV